jgi:2-polyprenyl-3-methyl-5-hydroxy-6-metoxy-1,4-benzoquinol methylase
MTWPDASRGSCQVCGGDQLRGLDAYAEARLVRCVKCGFTFASSDPSDDELAAHYENYGTAWIDSPITRNRYQELLRMLEPYRRTNRILDVGCGAGFFLEEAASLGWQVHGTEAGARALEINRNKGFSVVAAPTAAEAFPAGHFDVVTAFEVIEHVRDPRREVQSIAKWLRTDGLFYCTTPNFDSFSRRALGPRWTIISYPEHLSYFTPTTLTRLLTDLGFEQRRVVTTGISPSALRTRVRRSDSSTTRTGQPDDERLRTAAEASRVLSILKSSVNWTLSSISLGDTIKGYFELRA